MVSPKLSPTETQRIVNAATNDLPVERSSEPIHDHIEYKAFSGRQVLFVALIEEAFESLWRSALDVYDEVVKRLKRERKEKARQEKKAQRRARQ